MRYKVLVIDDEFLIRISLREGLSDLGYIVETSDDIESGVSVIETFQPDFVLLDNKLNNKFGIDYIETIKKTDEDIQIVLMTAYGSVSQAVVAIKRGAYDYIQKPFDIEEIDIIIKRSLEQLKNKRNLSFLQNKRQSLIGKSSATKQVLNHIDILAKNYQVDVLVRGETGTGKEVVANLIHYKSSRKDYPIVKINCGAIPQNLLESELFGYERGAFTGAIKSKKGLLELANGGTIFLDEIGEMPVFMQSKLLNFLEDRQFKRVGGLNDIQVNVRVIAATNRDLEEAISQGKFRQDLFYRLNVMQIEIPPLRQRREDIEVICLYYLEYFNEKLSMNIKTIDKEFLNELINYSWKGNVRELRNVLERCFLFSHGETLKKAVFLEETKPCNDIDLDNVYQIKNIGEVSINLENEVAIFERMYIDKALKLCNNNYTKAAEILNTTRFTLKRKISK